MNIDRHVDPAPDTRGNVPKAPHAAGAQPWAAVFFEPRRAFRALLDGNVMWLPLFAYAIANIVLATVWLERVDLGQFTRAQLSASGAWSELTPERQDAAMSASEESRVTLGVVSSVAPPAVVVLIALFFLALFNLRASGSLSFRGSLGVVALSHAAVAMVYVPLTLATMALRADWNQHPMEAFRANPTLLIGSEAVSYPTYMLVQSFDLFALWLVYLMIVGFSEATRRPLRAVAPFVLWPWVAWVAAKFIVTALVVP